MEEESYCTELQSPESLRESGHVPLKGPWLLEAGGPGTPSSRVLRTGETLVIGNRSPATWHLEDSTVSGCHARISATERGLELEDLSSKNGTFVSGARVQRAQLLASARTVTLGSSTISISQWTNTPQREVVRPISGLIGTSEPMRRLIESIRRIAPLDTPVLLKGESGTGKDVVARAIHRLSKRSGRYVALNAGSLSDSLADSELFGHRRGAFTGAVQTHAGAFEQADGGTLFLDEVADLAPSVQVKLLRAVELGEVRQLGAVAPLRVKARIVAATWASLEERIEAGSFRADLYHRISTMVIEVPPLRSRKSDIPLLARSLFNAQENQLGPRVLSDAGLARLCAHHFPGNVRELFAILYRAALTSSGPEVGALDIDAAIPPSPNTGTRSACVDAAKLLAAHDGNVSAAARSARVARSTFRSWLKRSAPGDEASGPNVGGD